MAGMKWGLNGGTVVDDNVIFSWNPFFDSFMEKCIAVVTEQSNINEYIMRNIFIKIQTRMALVLPDSVVSSIVVIIDDNSI